MLKRRDVLAAMVTAAVSGVATPHTVLAQTQATSTARRLPWRNWSGSQKCLPQARVAPASVAELQEFIANSTGTIRPVGAGHSFTPLVPTDGSIVSLARLSGVIDHDPSSLQATLWAGTRLGDIGKPLSDAGQALINMPDIDEQALGGCLATATHGTGADIGCMSTFVRGMQIVDGRGELHNCSENENPELFQAARVSLGSLGFITQVRLQNLAEYRLRRETHWHPVEEILANAESLADKHRNFEFYVIPFSGMGFTDAHDLTDEPIGSTEKIDGNEGVEQLKTARDFLSKVPKLRQLILGGYMRTLDSEISIERSWKNYASERNVRFNEMEYHLPREHGITALKEIVTTLEEKHPEVFFPIEVRYIKSDDLWLSPFYGRETCSIAVHRYFDEDFRPYFKTIEPIFRKYQGRPHWGKLNSLTREDFQALYPRWQDFVEVRRAYDPKERFLNPYLRGLFSEART